MPIASINPTTGETLKKFSALDSGQIEEKLAKAERAFATHRRTSFAQRAERLNAAANLLEQEQDRLARIMTLEMGKLLRAAGEEVTKCVRGCRFYAEKAEQFLADQDVRTEATRSYIRYEPMGNAMIGETQAVFIVPVDYSQSLGQMIRAGEYDEANGDINPRNFRLEGAGCREVE